MKKKLHIGTDGEGRITLVCPVHGALMIWSESPTVQRVVKLTKAHRHIKHQSKPFDGLRVIY